MTVVRESIAYRCGNDERNRPIDGNNRCPQPFAPLAGKRRRTEKFDENVVVQDFDATVSN